MRKLGHSYKEILEKVKVSKSTLSVWLRNIEIPIKGKLKLSKKTGEKRIKAAKSKKRFHKQQRIKWQQEGCDLARQNKTDYIFVSGCMLYWGEGYKKSRESIGLTNSDPELIIIFLKFLKKYFPNPYEKIKCAINCYTDIHSYKKIQKYWASKLKIDLKKFTKPQINNSPKSSIKKRKNLLPYGTCCVRVCDVKSKQILLGAIQELGKFSRNEWLD